MLRTLGSAYSLATVSRTSTLTASLARLNSLLVPSPRLYVNEPWAGQGTSSTKQQQQLRQQMKPRTQTRTHAGSQDSHNEQHSPSPGSKISLTLPTILTLSRVAAVPVLIGGKGPHPLLIS